MSQLIALCESLEHVVQPLPAVTGQLQQRARRLRSLAEEVQAAARAVPDGPDCSRVVSGLHEAARALDATALALMDAVQQGRSYIQRTAMIGGSTPTGTLHSFGASTTASTSRSAEEAGDPRYVHPGENVEAVFAQLVATFGTDNPSGWINFGNSLYSTGQRRWTENCGPCARSFADTFQGISTVPALGDAKIPPGELNEMWEALGITPGSSMTNKHATPAAFRESAYQAVREILSTYPPGTVAIIGVDWDKPGQEQGSAGGHWFNAYVDRDGSVKWADMQIGGVSDWPPGYTLDIWRLDVVVRPSADAQWEELVL